MDTVIKQIARIETDFGTKFGVPRQAGISEKTEGRIVFEKEYRNPDALRGIEGFSHIWLIWGFSAVESEGWQPTVRPPRLGGNERMGVFATRSPFRPNRLGLSCVRLLRLEQSGDEGTVLIVGGADLMNGTPIYDIKPYIPYADCRQDASSGYAPDPGRHVAVSVPPGELEKIPPDKREALIEVLSTDPRPGYHSDPERIYGMSFAGRDVRFRVSDGTAEVTEII